MPYFKVLPEDFRVDELMKFAVDTQPRAYAYYLLRKRNKENFTLFRHLASKIHLRPHDIGYAGIKDKRAVTQQHISIPAHTRRAFDSLRLDDVQTTFLGYADKPVTLGDHEGNSFHITVRNIPHRLSLQASFFINLFDTQRIGDQATTIGRALVRHDFKTACELLDLSAEGKNYIGALRTVDKKLLRFYVGAYQSLLWNKVAEHAHKQTKKIPLLGFLTTFNSPKIKNLYQAVMKEEQITPDHFLFRELPELSAEGSERDATATLRDFSSSWKDDDLYPGMLQCQLSFTLPKGAYATLVIKDFFPGAQDKSL